MKTKTIIPLFIFSLIALTAFCIHYSDSYLIGANAYTKNYYPVSLNRAISDSLKQGGFNAGVCSAQDNSGQAGVVSMLGIMDLNGIDGIFEDCIFDTTVTPPIYGARTLSGGNFYRFEAEYADSIHFGPFDLTTPDKYFYMSPNADSARVGVRDSTAGFSNGYYWQVNNGQEGYAYHDLTYKWPKEGGNYYYRVGQEFRFPYKGVAEGILIYDQFNSNVLYITFAMQVDNIDSIPDSTILADIRFTNKGENTNNADSTTILHYISDTDSCYVSHITKGSYYSSPYINNPIRHLITVSIPLRSLQYQGAIMDHGSGFDKLLVNLNPTLFWRGHGTLKLDYIDFEDKLHRDYTDNVSVLANMVSNRSSGLRYLYGMNEPQPGQFESFRRISRYLETVPDTIELITPVHNYKKEVIRADGTHFSNRTAYYKAVEPKIFMVNEYPFTHYTAPNWADTASSSFVQKYIDIVCKEYKTYKDLCGNNTRFFAVPQTWGKWDTNSQRWDYLFPPDKVAKSLQLLPLCYKAEGIISSSFFSMNNLSGEGYRTFGLMNMFGTENLYPTPQYKAIMAANQKIKVYGRIIKDLNWLGAGTVMTDTPALNLSSVLLDDLYVPPIGDSPLYQGYIQAGLYSDITTNKYFIMLVNRRATIAPSYLSAIPPGANNLDAYNNLCRDAPAQKVRFRPNSAANSIIGDHLALYDPFDKTLYKQKGRNIDVVIRPGDGKLLQIVSDK